MKRRTVTFTVQIQTDVYGQPGKKQQKIASELCDDINRILANYEGTLGGAQIMSEPKGIKIDSLDD